MNNNTFDFGSQHATRACVLFFACVLPAMVFAGTPQATQQLDSDDQSVPFTAQTAAGAASLGPGINGMAVDSGNGVSDIRGKNDAVLAQDEIELPPLISLAFTSTDSEQSISGSTDTGSGRTEASERDDTRQIPYSLMLALFAIIGLVPVLRRNR